MYINATKCVYKKVIIQKAFYKAESWGLRRADRQVNVLEMKVWEICWECRKWLELGMMMSVDELE